MADRRPTSRIPGFYRLTPAERLDSLSSHLGADVLATYRGAGLSVAEADLMVENVIGTLALPNAVALNFLVDGVERVVPMTVEEPSVLAAVSNMARLLRKAGGFTTEVDPSVMIGQVQVLATPDADSAAAALTAALPKLHTIAQAVHPRLVERGGGIRDLEVRRVTYDEPGQPREDYVVLHFLLDCVDAMGANMINTVAEHLAPHVEAITGETVGLRILSNLADRRRSRARVAIPVALLGTPELPGAEVADRVAAAWRFAWADPYRAATHNKGVMNGIDAVALATGNDWRAIEAGAHAWAARDGQYRPVTVWRLEGDVLVGTIEVPLQLGTVGGSIRVHPTVQANLALMGHPDSRELSGIAAAVGLAQNLAALRALATEGIQQGHMRMHARTVAGSVGADRDEARQIAAALVEEEDFSVERAEALLAELRGG